MGDAVIASDDELDAAVAAAWALSGERAAWRLLLDHFAETGRAAVVCCPEHAHYQARNLEMERQWCLTCGRPRTDVSPALTTPMALDGLRNAGEGRDILNRRIWDDGIAMPNLTRGPG